ncbi:M56 family metallopeptidase [Spongiibacter tropicus]|uniref:M56 family metallopeptidase n=1 Tax=Spongiibacter tropicus TaxID=454602 RepID=UPI003A9929ED
MTELLFLLKWAGIWLLVTVLAEWLAAACYPLFHRGIAPLNPALRSTARLLFSMTAPLSSIAVVALLNQPALLEHLLAEHCHDGRCGVHSPVHANAGTVVAVAMLSGLLVLQVFAVLIWSLHLSQRRFRLLEKLTEAETGQALRVIDTPGILASCVGLLRPKVFVSRQLTQQLSAAELQAVIAHEQAHAYRLDNLKSLMLRWSSLLWPPVIARRIRQGYQHDAELACDQLAGKRCDPAALHSALEKMSGGKTALDTERLRQSEELQAAGGRDVLQKVLLSLLLFFSVVGLVFVLLNAAHMGIEWLGEV